MDDSHVSLLEVKIKKEWFSTYESEDEVFHLTLKYLPQLWVYIL